MTPMKGTIMDENEGPLILAAMLVSIVAISAYGYHVHVVESMKRKHLRDYSDWWKTVQETDIYQKASPLDRMRFLEVVKQKFPIID